MMRRSRFLNARMVVPALAIFFCAAVVSNVACIDVAQLDGGEEPAAGEDAAQAVPDEGTAPDEDDGVDDAGDEDDADKDDDVLEEYVEENICFESPLDPSCVGGSGAGLLADFNGDGLTDLAVGVPGEDVDGVRNQGAVHILFGSPTGITSKGSILLTPGEAAGDRAGAALAAGDFDTDGFADLAVGIPGADVDGEGDAGAVKVFYGPDFTEVQEWNQNTGGIEGAAEQGDRFGTTLAVGDFDANGRADLVIGVPGEDVDGVIDAGAVNIIYGSAAATGLNASDDQLFHLGMSRFGLRFGDRFGSALAVADFYSDDGADDLAIGVPFRGVSDAGIVVAIFSRPQRGLIGFEDLLVSPSAGVGDHLGFALAAGDFNGDGIPDLAIGVPGKDIEHNGATIRDAGAVTLLLGPGLTQHRDFHTLHQAPPR